MSGCSYQIPFNVVFSGKFQLVLCQKLSGEINKNSLLNQAPPIWEIERKLKHKKCRYFRDINLLLNFVLSKFLLKVLLNSKDTQKQYVCGNFQKWLHNYSDLSFQAI